MQKSLQINLQCQEILLYTAAHSQILKFFFTILNVKCFVLGLRLCLKYREGKKMHFL